MRKRLRNFLFRVMFPDKRGELKRAVLKRRESERNLIKVVLEPRSIEALEIRAEVVGKFLSESMSVNGVCEGGFKKKMR